MHVAGTQLSTYMICTWLETFHNNKGRCAGYSKVFNNPPGGRAVNITVESIGSIRTDLHLKVGAQSEKILSWPRYESATFDTGAIGTETELRMSAQILISFFFWFVVVTFFLFFFFFNEAQLKETRPRK